MRFTLTILLSIISMAAFCQLEVIETNPIDTSDSLSVDTPAIDKGPTILFDSLSLNIGTIPEDTIVHRTFIFKNTGTDTLSIYSTKADCSCTKPRVQRSSYAPGENGSITVSFNSRQTAGRVLQYVTVFHNAKNGYTYLKLEGFVEGKL